MSLKGLKGNLVKSDQDHLYSVATVESIIADPDSRWKIVFKEMIVSMIASNKNDLLWYANFLSRCEYEFHFNDSFVSSVYFNGNNFVIVINPLILGVIHKDQIIAILKHSAGHMINHHFVRSSKYESTNKEAVEIAMDIVINGSRDIPYIKDIPGSGNYKDSPLNALFYQTLTEKYGVESYAVGREFEYYVELMATAEDECAQDSDENDQSCNSLEDDSDNGADSDSDSSEEGDENSESSEESDANGADDETNSSSDSSEDTNENSDASESSNDENNAGEASSQSDASDDTDENNSSSESSEENDIDFETSIESSSSEDSDKHDDSPQVNIENDSSDGTDIAFDSLAKKTLETLKNGDCSIDSHRYGEKLQETVGIDDDLLNSFMDTALKEMIDDSTGFARGFTPGEAMEAVSRIDKRKSHKDWKKIFNKKMRNYLSNSLRYREPNKSRQHPIYPDDLDLYGYSPGKKPKLAVVLDVSGSVDEKLLTALMSEVQSIQRKYAIKNVTLVQVDAEIKKMEKFGVRDKFIIRHGGGGTVMELGFKALLKQSSREIPDIIICATDGDIEEKFEHVKVPSKVQVIWLVPKEGKLLFDTSDYPKQQMHVIQFSV